jgi:hypothetical protein
MSNHTKETDSYKETLKNGEVRYKAIKPCNIDNRFWITSDSHNLILVDYQTVKPRYHFFPNIKLLSHCVVEFKAKEFLGKDWGCLRGINDLALSYDAVMKDVALKLEDYLQTIIEE